MSYCKTIMLMACLSLMACNYSFFVKSDRVISSIEGYIVFYGGDKVYFIPQKKIKYSNLPAEVNGKIGYRIYGVRGMNEVSAKSKPLEVNLRYLTDKNEIYEEPQKMIISPVTLNYIQRKKKDLWEKGLIEFSYKDQVYAFYAYASFKGDVLSVDLK